MNVPKTSIVAGLTTVPSSDGKELLAVAHCAEWLEVRADLVGDLDTKWVRERFPGRLIYSLRSSSADGAFEGSAADRAGRIRRASESYDLVELESENDLHTDLPNHVPAERRMLSWYGRPKDYDELVAVFNQLSATPSRFYKMVVEGRRSADALAPLRLLKSLGRSDVIAFASAETGLWSRLVAPYFSAPLIFATATSSATADGLPSVFQLTEDYGLPHLSPVNEIYGIVGNPVSHSLSPRLHNAGYRALGRAALFVPFQVESFTDFWRDVVTSGTLESLGFSVKGLTVASPYKEAAFQEAGASSLISRRIGAANVFLRRNGKWKADTTDPEGVVLAIRNRGLSLKGKKAAVVGCGGAGRAVAAALDQSGARVTLVNRGWERGRLAADLLGLPLMPLSSFTVQGFSILVNATPVGRDDDKMPFELVGLSEDALVVDLVYGSRPTPLVSNASALGRDTVDGQEVLLIQVLHQFRKMTGLDMPADLACEVLGCKRNLSIRMPTRNSMQVQGGVMSDQLQMMRADAKQAVNAAPDVSPLLGTWVNTDPRSDYISKLTVAERNGRIYVRAYGTNSSEPIDWGEIEATPYGTHEAIGFHARYDFGGIETCIAANQKLGILVIQSYISFRDTSDRVNRFAREFFHQ